MSVSLVVLFYFCGEIGKWSSFAGHSHESPLDAGLIFDYSAVYTANWVIIYYLLKIHCIDVYLYDVGENDYHMSFPLSTI